MKNITKNVIEGHRQDFGEAFAEVVQHLTSPKVNLVKDPADIRVVGHRVVHGADRFSKATLITPGPHPRIE